MKAILILLSFSHLVCAQPKLSLTTTSTSTSVILSGAGLNPSALQFSITIPLGATISPNPTLVGAGKLLYSYIPPNGPATLLIVGGISTIADGTIATISYNGTFTPILSKPIAVDASSRDIGLVISTPGVPCDLNQDGVVNLIDVLISIDQALGRNTCVNDINGDGSCTVLDVQREVNAAAGGICKIGA